MLGDLPRLPTPFGMLLYTSPTRSSVEDRPVPAPRARSAQVQRHEGVLPRVRQQSARDVFLGDPTNGLGRKGGAVRSLAPILCALMFARRSPSAGRRSVPLRVGAPGRFRRPLGSGTIAEEIFTPWTAKMREFGDRTRRGRRVRRWSREPVEGEVVATAANGRRRLPTPTSGHGHRRRRRGDHRLLARAARGPTAGIGPPRTRRQRRSWTTARLPNGSTPSPGSRSAATTQP